INEKRSRGDVSAGLVREDRSFVSPYVLVTVLVVRAKKIAAEVAPRIVPHRMDVIRSVLRVVELDQQRRSVNPVIVGAAGLERPRPREVQPLKPGLTRAA